MKHVSPEGFSIRSTGETYGAIKTVRRPEEVGPGWALIEIVYEDVFEGGSIDVPVYTEGGGSGCTGYWSSQSLGVKAMARKPLFVMGHLRDKEIEELKSQLESEQHARGKAERTAQEFTKMANDIHVINLKLEKQRAELLGELAEARSALRNTEEKCRLMEKHIGKIRDEIGVMRMKEILGIQELML